MKQTFLAPANSTLSLALSYLAMAVSRAQSSDGERVPHEMLSNLRYAQKEMERASAAYAYAAKTVGGNDAARVINFCHPTMWDSMEKMLISTSDWDSGRKLVENGGLAFAIEFVSASALEIAHIIKEMKKREGHASDDNGPAALGSAGTAVIRYITDLLETATAVSLIADMAIALKCGQREVYGIKISLRGLPASDVCTRKMSAA